MDYGKLIDQFNGIACIISLRHGSEKDKPLVCITAANMNYIVSVGKQHEEFVPNRPYTYYIPADSNFEALVSHCLQNHKIEHQYVNADLYRAWLDLYMIPLEDDDEGNKYCLFTYEQSTCSETDKIIDISAKSAYSVLKTCIKLRETDDFKYSLNSIVKDIRDQCESDGCSIILINNEEHKIDLLFFDYIKTFAPMDDDIFFKPEFYAIVQRWRAFMAGSNCFILSNEEELKEIEKKDVEWYNSLVFSGIHNLVLYPLRVGSNLYGYILATNFNSENTAFIREVMELNSYIISAEVENYRMHQKLKQMSTVDLLTGVFNRNALNKKISALIKNHDSIELSVGVVYADVNGLKQVNDTQGHNKGDELIRNVADRLKSVYTGKDIYRAGGDEFLVILTDISRIEFYYLFKLLKEAATTPGQPTFAIGAFYDDIDKDIMQAMQIADKNMYENKSEFYKSHPDLEQRRI